MVVGNGVPTPATKRPSPLRLLGGQVGYQLRVLVRSPIGSFATLVIPLIVLLAVNLLYQGTDLPSRGGITYAQFFTPAMVAFAVVNACYMSVISSTTLARDEGILKRLRGTPLPPWLYMAGRLGAAAVVALASTVVVIAVGALVYNFDIIWHAIPGALLLLALGAFCFCALGLAVTVLVPAADSALPVAWGTILPLCFISDVFMPIDGAPHWLRAIASFFPLRPLADALEGAFNPVKGSSALQPHAVTVLAIWGAGATIFALLAFRWQPRAAGHTKRGPHASATSALDRAHELFDRYGTRTPQPQHSQHAAIDQPPVLDGPFRLPAGNNDSTARSAKSAIPANASDARSTEAQDERASP
jgi:ABC-2 type transport system permease protein